MLADRLHHLAMAALLPLHMDRDHGMGRRDQEQDMENQPENRAKHDQNEVEDRRKRLPIEEQPKRRQQDSQHVDHRTVSGRHERHTHRAAFRKTGGVRNRLYDSGVTKPRSFPVPIRV